jgi:hypothetical protein
MNQRHRVNRRKAAPRGQANRPTKLDWRRSAKYRFVDLCYRLAGFWPPAWIPRLPGLELEEQARSFLKGFLEAGPSFHRRDWWTWNC